MKDLTKSGLSDNTIKKIHSIFSKYPEIKKVILYGSRALGTFRNGSDIDLTIDSNELSLTTLLKIENELDDLLLPYKIDLSIIKNIDNDDLIDHIRRVGVIFYSKV
jgi:predicted nucleotidyltransferase